MYVKEFKGVNPKFIYYLLRTLDFTGHNSGSAVPSLNRNYLHPIEITIPQSLQTQAEIAGILSSLDDKIELNLQMNKTLENIAQTIFKEWFVKFNFPDFDGVLENGLPRGWRVGRLEEIIDFIVDNRGKTPDTNEKGIYPLIEVNSLIDSSINISLSLSRKYVDFYTYNSFFRKGHPKRGDVLFATVGSVGNTALVFDEKFCIAQNIIGLRSKFKGYFLFFKLKELKRKILNLDISSVQPSIKVPHLLRTCL